MFYPYWSYQPKIRKRTVVMTDRGWTVKETGELLVSNIRIKERMSAYLGADSAEFTADKIILDMQGKSVDLDFNEIRAFIDSPTDFIPVSVASVSVLPTTFSKVVGTTQQLTPTVLPADAANKAVTYTSADPLVATVSPTGLVTAVKVGSSVITVKTVDGDKIATSTATVTPVLVASVTVSPTTKSLVIGATQQLTPTVLPANAANKAVTYTSSVPAVASVSVGGLVTAFTEGSTVITVNTTDGNKTATSAITVTAA